MALERGDTVEELVFGTRETDAVDARIDRFCAAALGSGVAVRRLRESSVGIVRGAILEDGRAVLVKVHQPRERLERLTAVQRLQAALHRAGFPCPEPLLAPTPLGHGIAYVETLLERGEPRDCDDPAYRSLIAEALAEQLAILRRHPVPDALRGDLDAVRPRRAVAAGGPLRPRRLHRPLQARHGRRRRPRRLHRGAAPSG